MLETHYVQTSSKHCLFYLHCKAGGLGFLKHQFIISIMEPLLLFVMIKVIIDKSRGEVSQLVQDTIENVS